MRIIVVADVFPALSETFVLDQVVSLIERGHDVSIIADRPRAEPAMHEDIARHGLLRRTHYLAPPQTWRGRLAVLARAARHSRFRLIGTAVALRRARKVGEVGGLRMLALVAALAKAPRPDIILCHFGPNGSLAIRALDALGWAVPVVTIFHGFDLSRLVKQRGPHLYDYLFRNGRLFLPVCQAFADRLGALGCPPGRTMVQRMGVDLAELDAFGRPHDQATPHAGTFTFLSVGRLVAKKGTAHAIRAFAGAFGHLPPSQVRLRVVGDGPLRGDLSSMAQACGVAAHVEFLGALPRVMVLSTMQASDALVQASVTAADGDMEGVPVVIAEAMALGKPVLGTRHSGIPELVLDGVTGRLLEEGDKAGLTAAMAWMVANRQATAQMGRAGRARLKAGFTANYWNTLLEQRLQSVVSASGGDTETR